ncbi:MAG: hypothetical protein ACRC2M_03950 [Planktothrix sp.]
MTLFSFSTKRQNPKVLAKLFKGFLTRFEAIICVITDSPHPNIITFSPQAPHLIETMITWVKWVILEI